MVGGVLSRVPKAKQCVQRQPDGEVKLKHDLQPHAYNFYSPMFNEATPPQPAIGATEFASPT